jgi:anti-anti-sigma regulatory factor
VPGRWSRPGIPARLLTGQAFRADRAVRWLTGQLKSAKDEGFPGLRVAVDMSWALRPVTGIEQLPQFEEGISAGLPGTTAAVLCLYDRDRFDPVTLASVAGFHTRSVAAATYYADPVLRICRQYAPAGLRIAGEIDYQAADHLALALAETVRNDGDITLNLAALAFIDAQCTLLIAQAARAIVAANGTGARSVVLRCPAEIADGFARLGLAEVPGVRLVTDDG